MREDWEIINTFYASLNMQGIKCIQWNIKPTTARQEEILKMIQQFQEASSDLDIQDFKKELLALLANNTISFTSADFQLRKLFTNFQWCSIQDFIARELDGYLQLSLPHDKGLKEYTSCEHIKLILKSSIQPNQRNFDILKSLFIHVKEWFYDKQNNCIILTFPNHSLAKKWAGLQLPWQGRMLQLEMPTPSRHRTAQLFSTNNAIFQHTSKVRILNIPSTFNLRLLYLLIESTFNLTIKTIQKPMRTQPTDSLESIVEITYDKVNNDSNIQQFTRWKIQHSSDNHQTLHNVANGKRRK